MQRHPMLVGVENDRLDGERLEGDWERALESASTAVGTGRDAHVLSRSAAKEASARISADRKWLSRFRSSMRSLFPKRSAYNSATGTSREERGGSS